jgi:hypothetical protein
MLRPNTAAVMVITLFAVANLACGIHMPAQSHTDPHQGGDYPPTVATPEATGKSYTVPPAEPASGTGGLQVAITATGPDQDCQEDHYLFNVPSALLKESFPRLTYDEVLKGDQRFTNWVTS